MQDTSVAMGPADSCPYELRFQSLFDSGRALVFPCDAAGKVDLDALSHTARGNYFYARTVVGREFSCPAVKPARPPRAGRPAAG